MSAFYNIPLNTGDVMKKNELPRCAERESIDENILLMLTTYFGEFRYDETYGCSLWEHDFENIVSATAWKENIGVSIRETIKAHEPRLTNVIVTTEIKNETKRRVDIKVNGNLAQTNKPYFYFKSLYVSPFSFD